MKNENAYVCVCDDKMTQKEKKQACAQIKRKASFCSTHTHKYIAILFISFIVFSQFYDVIYSFKPLSLRLFPTNLQILDPRVIRRKWKMIY